MHREVFGQGEGGSPRRPPRPRWHRVAPRPAAGSLPQTPSLGWDPPEDALAGCRRSPTCAATAWERGRPPKTGAEPQAEPCPRASSAPRRGAHGKVSAVGKGKRESKPSQSAGRTGAFGEGCRSYADFPAAPAAGTSGDGGTGWGANSLGAARAAGARAAAEGERRGPGKGPVRPPAPARAAGSFRRGATNEN